MKTATLKVTSHVARDLLQSSALFQHEHSVVWEYVSNGLQYVDPGIQPVVDVLVDVKDRRIVIRDNGSGMSMADLNHYFQMHGENIDRKKGRAGRGKFGTGKSAAFGIGDTLRLTTVRNGARSKVELNRKSIEEASDGEGIPVRIIDVEVATNDANGTIVEIEGIHLKKMDVASIARHIERHITHWPNASVIVNHVPCNVSEPPCSERRVLSSKGTAFESALGDVKMVVKLAKAPLDQEWQGIAVLSNNIWYTTTLAGCEGKPFANYIFGEIEVPRLAEDKSPITAFDMSRSMRLNLQNELVAQIFAFIGSSVETLRRELEKADRERRKAQDAKKLLEEANAIARIINQDFDSWRNQVQRTIAKVPGGVDRLAQSNQTDNEGESLAQGSDLPAIVTEGADLPEFNPGPPRPSPDVPSVPPAAPSQTLEAVDEGETNAGRKGKKRTARVGGFKVDFTNMGVGEPRAKYERNERTIWVNLEHPQIAAAKSIGEDVAFRRLSYEVAFSEYAIALASELADGDWYQDVTDPIVDIRATINRISRAAAHLYAKS